MGLRRVSEPWRIASSRGIPYSRKDVKNETNTKPFNTATPNKAINPTAAEIDNGIPLNHKKMTPPVRANGIPVNTRAEFLIEPKAA